MLIKLGGSVITEKNAEDVFLREKTLGIARIVKDLLFEGEQVLITHGTGSFGKPPAVRFGYLSGYLAQDRIDVVALVQQKLISLNRQVMDTFLAAGVPAALLSTNSIVQCSRGEIAEFETRAVKEYLDRGIVPVMHGDIVPDQEMGFCVCTSDKITMELARLLQPNTVIFATDIDGVYAEEASSEEGKPMSTISPEEYRRLDVSPETPQDVSGGMHAKVGYALVAARYCQNCWILNGNVVERLAAAVRGKDLVGTRVLADSPG